MLLPLCAEAPEVAERWDAAACDGCSCCWWWCAEGVDIPPATAEVEVEAVEGGTPEMEGSVTPPPTEAAVGRPDTAEAAGSAALFRAEYGEAPAPGGCAPKAGGAAVVLPPAPVAADDGCSSARSSARAMSAGSAEAEEGAVAASAAAEAAADVAVEEGRGVERPSAEPSGASTTLDTK